MPKTPTQKGEAIRKFIIQAIERGSKGPILETIEQFSISRQAVHKHVKILLDQKIVARTATGQYQLCVLEEWKKTIRLSPDTREDVVWRSLVRDKIGALPGNVVNIWHYGFTEIFNNVIDHSESKGVFIGIRKTALSTEMLIFDRGIGIFNKIKSEMGLLDERHAVLELTKGKLTTDPHSHSGEGIFFTSRMFDNFSILSSGVFLSHRYDEDEDWMLEARRDRSGTLVSMKLRNDTNRIAKEIFDSFTTGEKYGFTKTVVPVRLAQYGEEWLVSRSQAKRLLERVDRFKTVLLDFTDVTSIGQAFADEIFRVFPAEHPDIEIIEIKANKDVTNMISRVRQSAIMENPRQGSLFNSNN